MSNSQDNKPKKGHFRKLTEDRLKYWKTTYRQLNPFKGTPEICKECGEDAKYHRRWWKYSAVSIEEFKCPNNHTWSISKTHD